MAKKRNNSGQQRAINAADKRKIGRPSKQKNQKLLETVLDYLRQGYTKMNAAAMAGMSYTTLRDAEINNPKFAEKVEVAQQRGIAAIHGRIARNKSWKAQAWLLSMLDPETYAKRKQVEHIGQVDHVHGGNITVQQLLIELDANRAAELEQLARTRLESGDASSICPPCQPGEVVASETPAPDRPSDLRNDPQR